MSLFCGNCGQCLAPSNNENWYTNRNPVLAETGCENCGHGMRRLIRLRNAVMRDLVSY